MSQNITLNGVSYTIPDTADESWGSNLTNFFVAIPQGVLQKSGGIFTLTADVNFGANFGLLLSYLKSRSANISTAGLIRLAVADTIGFRNNANSGNLLLAVNGSDQLTFNGTMIPLSGLIVNADISAAAAIAYSKLALTGAILNADLAGSIALSKLVALTSSRALVSDGSGIVSVSAVTGTELGYLSGVTSAIQTQIGTKAPSASPTFSGTITTPLTASRVVKTGASSELTTGTVNLASSNEVTGALPIANGGTGQTAKTASFDALSPNSTAGDITLHNGTNNVRLAIGTDGQVPVVDTSQTNKLKWATLPQGNKNYITYNNFENNATTGWSLSHSTLDSTTKLPNQASGSWSAASGNLSQAVTSTNPLAGSYSLQLVSSAATAAGDMWVSQAYTVDREDYAKPLGFKFYFEVVSGASNGNFSGTSSNSFGVAIYDVTAGAWVDPAGRYNIVQSAGAGIAIGSFQLPSTSTQFRIALYNVNATAGAITLNIDDVSVGPAITTYGAPVTDFVAYTPTFTGFGTVTGVAVYSRRVGNTLEGYGVFTSGTVSGTAATFTLGYNGTNANVTSDTTIGSATLVGQAGYSTNNTVLFEGGILASPSSGTLAFSRASSTGSVLSAQTGSGVVGNSTAVSFNFRVPIAGWSSTVLMSNDTDTRIVAAKYYLTAGQALTTGDNKLAGFTSVYDTHGAFNASNQYVAPVSGKYKFAIVFNGNASVTLTPAYKINGGSIVYIGGVPAHSRVSGGDTVQLSAGDYIEFYMNVGGSITASSGAGNTFFTIERLSGPATIAANESVSALYSGQPTGTLAGSYNTATFPTKVKDTHNIYSGGAATIPVSGSYSISAQTTQLGTYSIAQSAVTAIFIDGVQKYIGIVTTGTGNPTQAPPQVNVHSIPLLAGQVVTIRTYNGSTSPTFSTDATASFFSIVRTGN